MTREDIEDLRALHRRNPVAASKRALHILKATNRLRDPKAADRASVDFDVWEAARKARLHTAQANEKPAREAPPKLRLIELEAVRTPNPIIARALRLLRAATLLATVLALLSLMCGILARGWWGLLYVAGAAGWYWRTCELAEPETTEGN